MAFCSNCGNELTSGARFCATCGAGATSSISRSISSEKTVSDGKIHKCPNCGEILKSFVSTCPSCNYELRDTAKCSSIVELIAKIQEIDDRRASEGFIKSIKHKFVDSKLSPLEEQKISLISNFIIPNNKEDILEFMILSSSHLLTDKPSGDISEHDELLYNELKKAWKMKFEQAYDKAKICIKSDEDRAEIERCYIKTIIEPKKKAQKNTKIILISVFIPLILIIATIVLVTTLTADPSAIKAGVSYDDVEGQHYEDVVETFERNGFTNIEAREDGWHLFHKSGTVKSVTIDGKEEFYSFSKFPKDAKIIIFYYE